MQEFYYLDSQNQQQGPVGAHELIGRGVTRDTMVWKSDMTEWKPAGTVPELAAVFAPHPPVTPINPIPASTPFTPPAQPQPPIYNTVADKKPDNLLVWSILVTVLCCLPLGIVAIVQSSKVDKLWATGDRAGAEQAAKTAKNMIILSAVLGFVGSLIYGIAVAAAM